MGVRIGEGTNFIDPKSTLVDLTRPWMIEIGQSVCITGGVTMLTHDYGWSVTKAVYGDVIGSCGKICIGNNVYIGMNTTILAGVSIGTNVIIGANSLVSRSIPDNCVAVGSPATPIKSIEDYHEHRKSLSEMEAIQMVREYYSVYNKIPHKELLREHFWLFEGGDDSELIEEYKSVNQLVFGSAVKTKEAFALNKPKYNGYEDFINVALKQD